MQFLQVQYYSLFFQMAIIGGNIYLNCVIVGLGEVTSGLISGFMLSKFND